VPFGLRRELYLAEPDGDYERQPRTIREEIYGRKLVLEAGSTVTMFTRIPGIETHLGYARGDLSLKREFDVVADAVRFRG
ncbi:hypothetical protein KDA14_00915, partial [Candidatus Saccharibacteria bacterium]|nr:hypothetical protein [Candidatus Saccharibacteria bacterium]